MESIIARLDAAEDRIAELEGALTLCLDALREWESDPDISGISTLHIEARQATLAALTDRPVEGTEA